MQEETPSTHCKFQIYLNATEATLVMNEKEIIVGQ